MDDSIMKKVVSAAVISASLVLSSCEQRTVSAPSEPDKRATKSQQPAHVNIVRWGPDHAKAGESFNIQPDGNPGVWFELSGPVTGVELTATLDGKPLTGVVANGNIVTATIPLDYLTVPGTYLVELQTPSLGKKMLAGSFTVESEGN
jgi:hypothetical protein